MRRYLIYLLLTFCNLSFVHAFVVEIDGICYEIIGSLAAVTHQEWERIDGWYVGDIVIPEQITYKGQTYNVRSVDENAFAYQEELTSVKFPSTVRAFSACAFIGCTKLRQVSASDNLLVIGSSAFTGCTSLQSIALPRSSKKVDTLSFYCCASLSSLILPHRIRTVCQGALEHLPSLKNLYLFASEPPVAEQGAFTLSDQKRCTLHVPKETLEKYQQSPDWQDFYRIVPLTDAEYARQNYHRGDINDDGKVDALDLELMRLIIVNLPDDSAVRWAADINEDGKVNAADYVLLAKRL
ncbi:MAG: leucine-rich repeat protein [Bacteroidaceae bacterium]|nr:leucine-rich repeat protein [Bacteroidaceae bacterium]